MEFPLQGGGVLLVQAAEADAPAGGLGLASPTENKLKRASETLQSALAQVIPALNAVSGKLRELTPDELTVEFGLTLTAESGVIVAKGTAEVHFTVTLAWSKEIASPNGEVMAATTPDSDRSRGEHEADPLTEPTTPRTLPPGPATGSSSDTTGA